MKKSKLEKMAKKIVDEDKAEVEGKFRLRDKGRLKKMVNKLKYEGEL